MQCATAVRSLTHIETIRARAGDTRRNPPGTRNGRFVYEIERCESKKRKMCIFNQATTLVTLRIDPNHPLLNWCFAY